MPSSTMIGPLFAGLVSGLAISAIYGLSPDLGPVLFFAQFLNFVALIPTMTIGLSHGLVGAGFSVMAATATVGLMAGMRLAALYVLVFGAPQLWLIHLALLRGPGTSGQNWYPAGRMLGWLVLFAGSFLSVAWIVTAGQPGGLIGTLERESRSFLTMMVERQGIQSPDGQIEQLANYFAKAVPVTLTYLWVLVLIVNGSVAQAIAVHQGRNLRPTPKLSKIGLPDVTVYALGLFMIGAMILPGQGAELARTLAYMVTVAFFVLGLAVVHAFVARVGRGRGLIVVFYFFVAILTWLALAVMLLGLADKVFGLRRRFIWASKGQKEE